MLDNSHYARRVSPIERVAPSSRAAGAEVRALAPQARFSLRLRSRDGSSAPGEVARFRVDQKINGLARSGDRWSARLGPDEWLLGAAEDDDDSIAQEIEAALSGRTHSLVCVSHRNVAFQMSGPRAAEALNAGCPLDLSDEAFPAGSATRTLLGKTEIVLIRAGVEPVFQVECWRSFASYTHDFLLEAAEAASSA